MIAYTPGKEHSDKSLRLANHRNDVSEKFERQFIRKDGLIIPTFVSATPLPDGDGLTGLFAAMTERFDRIAVEEPYSLANLKPDPLSSIHPVPCPVLNGTGLKLPGKLGFHKCAINLSH
jgi:hypothetical protein